MPSVLIINTLADVLAELLFESVCISFYDFLERVLALATEYWTYTILRLLYYYGDKVTKNF